MKKILFLFFLSLNIGLLTGCFLKKDTIVGNWKIDPNYQEYFTDLTMNIEKTFFSMTCSISLKNNSPIKLDTKTEEDNKIIYSFKKHEQEDFTLQGYKKNRSITIRLEYILEEDWIYLIKYDFYDNFVSPIESQTIEDLRFIRA